jgi:hypothetical protein
MLQTLVAKVCCHLSGWTARCTVAAYVHAVMHRGQFFEVAPRPGCPARACACLCIAVHSPHVTADDAAVFRFTLYVLDGQDIHPLCPAGRPVLLTNCGAVDILHHRMPFHDTRVER